MRNDIHQMSSLKRWYRLLLMVEHDAITKLVPEKFEALTRRIDEIESEVNKMKVPAAYGDQFYVLRTRINFVRHKIENELYSKS